ncbi:retrotransposon protein, putative, ty1-copia subclass [Tanacetum coccineum]
MKNYVAQLERLGYVLPRDLSVGLIMNGLTSNFVGFVRNYNKHNMMKTSGELHALLIEYEKGKGKGKGKGKDKSYIPKPKNPKTSAKKHPTKDDTCHHCKEVGHCKRNCPAYLAELIKKKKQIGTTSSSDIFVIELFSFPTKSRVYDTSCGTHICNTKHGLRGVRKLKQVEATGSFELVLPNGLVICLDNCHYAPTITRGVVSVSCLVDNRFIQCFTDYGVSVSKNNVLYLMLLRVMLTPPYTLQHNGISKRRNTTLLDMVRSMMNLTTLPLSFSDYALETATCILNMVPTKKVNKTPYELWYGKVPNLSYLKETMGYYFYFPPKNKIVVARYAEFLEKNLLSQEVSGRAVELEEIQDEDTSPSKNTCEIPMEVEGFEPPQEKVVFVRRPARTHQAHEHLCLNVVVEEHSLGDLNEPTNYKAALLDQESDKLLGVSGFSRKKTDMDGNVHTYKAHLVAKDYTQTYGVVYEETFSPIADIRAIRILIGIEAFYDYEIWKMDVKTAFLNGYLDENIYMVSKHLIRLSQSAYMDKILKRYRMDNSKRGNISMQERLDLNKTQDASTPGEVKHMQNVPYASAVGEPHSTAVKTILKYLRNTKDMFLVYDRNPEAELRVDFYCNAGFEINRDEIKSQT